MLAAAGTDPHPYSTQQVPERHSHRLVLVKAAPVPGPRGFDGAKKVDASHVTTSSTFAGALIAAHLTAANVRDRATSPALLAMPRGVAPTISKVRADKGYTGEMAAGTCQQAGD